MKRKTTALFIIVTLFIGISSCEELTEPQPAPKNCEVEVFTVNTSSSKTVNYEVIKTGDVTVEYVKYYSDNGFVTINNPTNFPMTLNFTLSYELDSIGVFAKAEVHNGKIEVKMKVTSNNNTISQEDACSQIIN
ncbi:MAG: hypothetical protein L3J41_03195 [Melioribacteraceae bacterium]|nr:hypothetical protein [Melioribacteraceae bacterium]